MEFEILQCAVFETDIENYSIVVFHGIEIKKLLIVLEK